MSYQIQRGDNLYEIAKKHNISVDSILDNNPGINPQNLLVGSYIYLPIVEDHFMIDNKLHERMRQVWEQHVFWTRLLIVSIMERLGDEDATTKRLLRNADDLADIYRPYYGSDVASTIAKLITEHLVIAAKLVHAIVDNNTTEIDTLNTAWYQNADDIAVAFSSINPHYDKELLRSMLHTHLDLTKEEVINRFQKDHVKEIETFDRVEQEIIMMADYLTRGILKQFYQREQ